MQSRRGSIVESATSTAVGFALSFGIWQLVGPLMGHHVHVADNFAITSIFTAVSLARGFLLRRLFNRIRL